MFKPASVICVLVLAAAFSKACRSESTRRCKSRTSQHEEGRVEGGTVGSRKLEYGSGTFYAGFLSFFLVLGSEYSDIPTFGLLLQGKALDDYWGVTRTFSINMYITHY